MIRYRLPTFVLFVSVSLLSVFGLVMLYSTTAATFGEGYLKLQVMWISVGLVAAAALALSDYRTLTVRSRWILLVVAIPLLYLAGVHFLHIAHVPDSILGRLPFIEGGATKGAYRWLNFGGRKFQPSEFAKLALILFVAWYYGRHPRYVESFWLGLVRPLAAAGAVTLAILLGGSLSVTLITSLVILAMLFVSGIRLRWFLLFGLTGVLLITTVLIVSPTRMARVTQYLHPEDNKEGGGYQLWAGMLALGSGNWHGVGFNRSHMKEKYLPEAHTDFIMAIVGEELGLVTVLGVIVMYLVLIGAAFAISMLAGDREGMLLAFGIGVAMGTQAFVNLAVVSGFLPTTGITAPLISYGGSSMVATWAGIGLLASIARHAHREALLTQHNPYTTPREPLLTGTAPAPSPAPLSSR